jgi:hypothetical protein
MSFTHRRVRPAWPAPRSAVFIASLEAENICVDAKEFTKTTAERPLVWPSAPGQLRGL